MGRRNSSPQIASVDFPVTFMYPGHVYVGVQFHRWFKFYGLASFSTIILFNCSLPPRINSSYK